MTKKNFQECLALPNVKVRDRAGAHHKEGRELLRRMVTNRMDANLIEALAIEHAVELSGGHVRSLIALLCNSALSAAGRKSSRIEPRDVQRAAGRQLGDFIVELKSSHYPVLKARAADHALGRDEEMRELIGKLALLDYGGW